MKLPLLTEADVKDKTVFLRADLDAPLGPQRTIEDDTRLVAGLPTIEYLLKNQATVIIGSKLGRPKGEDSRLSLAPVADWLAGKFSISPSASLRAGNFQFSIKGTRIGQFAGWQITPKLFLLENLRFYKGEEENDPAFAKQLAELAQIYVNDSFAVSHRTHASIVGIPQYLPHFAGLRLQKEVEILSSAMENPDRPLVVIIGGAKMETKLPVVSKMIKVADYVLVGGKIASETKVLYKVAHQKVRGRKAVLLVANLNIDGADITEESLKKFLQIIDLAKTIIWNGPMGKIFASAQSETEEGTRKLARKIAESKAYTVVGGGDTAGFLKKMGLLDKFSFVSTGGGAMLDFLAGERLPGLEALLK